MDQGSNSNNNVFFDGSKKLADDLWEYLDGRDPYVVGAANIGKSTLTDSLIDEFLDRCTERQHSAMHNRNPRQDSRKSRHPKGKRLSSWEDQKKHRYEGKRRGNSLEEKRYDTIRQSRITKSSLPGTTLQNIRVPCFTDHTQALWDTPGLLLDPSVSHFPIRNFRRLKAMRPTKIQPRLHTVHEKSFAFLVYENNDLDDASDGGEGDNQDAPLPLLRVEVRLKKERGNDEKPGPVQVVWNSILGILSTNIASIDDCHNAEQRRMKEVQQKTQEQREEEPQQGQDEIKFQTSEERAAYKEKKRQEHLQKIKAAKKEMGAAEWKRREAIREEEEYQRKRLKKLAKLKQVFREELPGGKATAIDVAHFGSLGILCPRDALVSVFAPSGGVSVSQHPIMSLPPSFENERLYDDADASGGSDSKEDEWSSDDDDDGFGYDDDSHDNDEFDWFNDDVDGCSDDAEDDETLNDDNGHRSRYQRRRTSPAARQWAAYSGEHIGWRFHEKPHFVRGSFVDGWQPIDDKHDDKV